MHHEVIRGFNPAPVAGWSWCLTDYEVAYVTKFGVRPVRDSTWLGSPEDETRLDMEATVLAGQKKKPGNDAQFTVKNLVVVSSLLVLASLVVLGFAAWNFSSAFRIQDDTTHIEEQLNG